MFSLFRQLNGILSQDIGNHKRCDFQICHPDVCIYRERQNKKENYRPKSRKTLFGKATSRSWCPLLRGFTVYKTAYEMRGRSHKINSQTLTKFQIFLLSRNEIGTFKWAALESRFFDIFSKILSALYTFLAQDLRFKKKLFHINEHIFI